MAFTVVIDFDDVDIKQLVDSYNTNADEDTQITVQDIVDNIEVVKEALREFMFDQVIELFESENEEVYDFFLDIFEPEAFFDYEDEFEETPPRTH